MEASSEIFSDSWMHTTWSIPALKKISPINSEWHEDTKTSSISFFHCFRMSIVKLSHIQAKLGTIHASIAHELWANDDERVVLCISYEES